MTLNSNNDSQKSALDKIQSGAVKMRPKYFFVLETAILIFLVAVLLLITIFLVSFVLFVTQDQTAVQHSIGVHFFISVFPFIPTLSALLVALVAALLLKRFHFGYAHPFLYMLIGIVAIVIIISFFVRSTAFHQRFLCFSKKHQTPLFNDLYQQYKLHELCEHETGSPEPFGFWEFPAR